MLAGYGAEVSGDFKVPGEAAGVVIKAHELVELLGNTLGEQFLDGFVELLFYFAGVILERQLTPIEGFRAGHDDVHGS